MSSEFSADCGRCAALCCIHTTFSRSADFAIDKPAGTPCPHLGSDHRCSIHGQLRSRGFPGCVAFDCYGAGQRIVTRQLPESAVSGAFWEAFSLCELGWHVEHGLRHGPPPALAARLRALLEEVEAALDHLEPSPDLRVRCSQTLGELSAWSRRPAGRDLSRQMHLGGRFVGADLRRATLFAGCFVGADLRGADLRGADLRGADLRGARLEGADLRATLFFTPTQHAGARVDARTRLPQVPGASVA